MVPCKLCNFKLEEEVILLLEVFQSRTSCSTGMISAEPISGCCAVIMQMEQADWLFREQNKTQAAFKGEEREDERETASEGEKRRITKAGDEKLQVSVFGLFRKFPLLMQVIYQMAYLAELERQNCSSISSSAARKVKNKQI